MKLTIPRDRSYQLVQLRELLPRKLDGHGVVELRIANPQTTKCQDHLDQCTQQAQSGEHEHRHNERKPVYSNE